MMIKNSTCCILNKNSNECHKLDVLSNNQLIMCVGVGAFQFMQKQLHKIWDPNRTYTSA